MRPAAGLPARSVTDDDDKQHRYGSAIDDEDRRHTTASKTMLAH